ncbi:MAG: SMP-30/gluconolactonase/LRE family protein [Chloroflexi bacterium]|nr:SMP-30/gluconolactonase/LRE family protein [Chloroflexota bacterium]
MAVHVLSPKVRELIDPSTGVERLATGFLFTEGPLWDPARQQLLFSDLAGDVMRSWRSNEGIAEVRRPSGKSNGLTWDTQGRLIACEHVGRRLTRTETDSSITVLASEHAGQSLNSPNDVVVKSDGSIYFSDPAFGLMDYYGVARPQDLPFQGVYRISPEGEPRLLVDDFQAPNGLCFSPDESLLYIDDTARMHVRVFDVRPDGSLANGRLFFDFAPPERARVGGGMPDGMKLDERGNLYCTGPGGIWVISPAGTALGRIELPEIPSNLNWGELDWKTLYVTACTSIYRLQAKVAGNSLVYMK